MPKLFCLPLKEQIAQQVHLTRDAIGTWFRRFMKHRLAGLANKKGRDRKSNLPDSSVKKVLDEAVSPPAHLAASVAGDLLHHC